MRKIAIVSMFACLFILFFSYQNAFASVDNFDSYSIGPLVGQGNWYQFGSSASLNVVSSDSSSSPNAVYMKREGGVNRYAQYNDGNTDPNRNVISFYFKPIVLVTGVNSPSFTFDVYITDSVNTQVVYFGLYGTATGVGAFRLDNWAPNLNTNYTDVATGLSENVWYKAEVEFDWSTHTYRARIDGGNWSSPIGTNSSYATYIAKVDMSCLIPDAESYVDDFSLDSQNNFKLPVTGQTKCYDSMGTEIPCVGSGQDGEIQAGVAWPDPRFSDNGDGTITDNLTGLMWFKDANCATTIGHDPNLSGDGSMSWLNALDFVKGINNKTYDISNCSFFSANYSDWHLPNINELESLSNYGTTNNSDWLRSVGFANIQERFYWSSTSGSYLWDRSTPAAEVFSMHHGNTNCVPKAYSSYNPYHVLPVRQTSLLAPSKPWRTHQTKCYGKIGEVIDCIGTGQDGEIQAGTPWPEPRFKDNADGTVSDNLTGLMWTKNDCVLGGNDSWQNKIDAIAQMNAGIRGNYGYTDWRLPNVKELWSLLSFENNAIVFPSVHPFNIYCGASWASTTALTFGTERAWMVDYGYGGYTTINNKALGGGPGWPVRGGNVGPSPIQCTYTYSDWGACQSDGTQTRMVVSETPAGCTGTPVLSQSCNYVPPVTLTVAPDPILGGIITGPNIKCGTGDQGSFGSCQYAYVPGTEITLTASHMPGCTFQKWDNGWPFNPMTFNINNDYQVKAIFSCSLISGTITTITGDPLSGVNVKLNNNGSTSTIQTDSNGKYVFGYLLDDVYTITPEIDQYAFYPGNRTITIAGAAVTDQNFTGERVLLNISGPVWSYTCPSKFNGYFQVPYPKEFYDYANMDSGIKGLTITGNNLDKITSVSISNHDYSVSIKKRSKTSLLLDVRANNISELDPMPAGQLDNSVPSLIFSYNGGILTKEIRPGIIPTFYVDNQSWGQCTWYAGCIARYINKQGVVRSYSQGVTLSGDPLSSGFPIPGSVLMASGKHMAYLEHIYVAETNTDENGNQIITYNLEGSQYNAKCDALESTFPSGNNPVQMKVQVKQTKNGTTYKILQYPTVVYTVTKIKQPETIQ